QVIERDELAGRLRTLAGLGADHLDPLHQLMIEGLVGADGVVDALAALDQPRQDVVDITDGKGIVGAVMRNRTVLAGTQTVPQLALGVTLTAEQHVLTVLATGNQGNYGLGLRKAGEVLEIAV